MSQAQVAVLGAVRSPSGATTLPENQRAYRAVDLRGRASGGNGLRTPVRVAAGRYA